MMETQKPWSVTNGIGANLPITAKAAKISDIMKTTVDGGDRFISQPSLFIDERIVIVLSEKARGPTISTGIEPQASGRRVTTNGEAI
jgi:hypothetical protein